MDELSLPPKPDRSVPRWVQEKYEGMEKDISEYLYSVQFWRVWNGKEAGLAQAEAKARALAEARFAALSHTFDMSDALERSKVWQLYQFKRNGWHHILGGEYETLTEVLMTIRDHLDSESSQLYQLDFLINTFLPAMERKGLPADLFTAIPDNFNKAIEAVPRLRRALDADDIDEAVEIIDKVVSPEESVRSLRDWLRDRRAPSLEPVALHMYLCLDGSRLAVLRLPGEAHQRFLETALRAVVVAPAEVHSVLDLMRQLADELLLSEVENDDSG